MLNSGWSVDVIRQHLLSSDSEHALTSCLAETSIAIISELLTQVRRRRVAWFHRATRPILRFSAELERLVWSRLNPSPRCSSLGRSRRGHFQQPCLRHRRWRVLQNTSRNHLPPCGEVEDILGVLTPVCRGVAQVFHDILVELRLLLVAEVEEGEEEDRQEEGEEVKGGSQVEEITTIWMTMVME